MPFSETIRGIYWLVFTLIDYSRLLCRCVIYRKQCY